MWLLYAISYFGACLCNVNKPELLKLGKSPQNNRKRPIASCWRQNNGAICIKPPAVSLADPLLCLLVLVTFCTIPREPCRKVKVFKDFDEVRRKGPGVLSPVIYAAREKVSKNCFSCCSPGLCFQDLPQLSNSPTLQCGSDMFPSI